MKISVNTPDLLADIHEKDAKYQNSLLCLFALGVIGFQTLTEQSGSDREDADSPIQRLEGMAARLENANLYQILSVSKEASPDEIQAAYHELAKQFHPDRFQSETFSTDIHQKAQHVFASINEAYQTLKNPGLLTMPIEASWPNAWNPAPQPKLPCAWIMKRRRKRSFNQVRASLPMATMKKPSIILKGVYGCAPKMLSITTLWA
jgi:hypothetical protein